VEYRLYLKIKPVTKEQDEYYNIETWLGEYFFYLHDKFYYVNITLLLYHFFDKIDNKPQA